LKLVLEIAKAEQIENICDLVNLAYRGENGWTKETDLVGGDRSNANEVQEYLSNPNAHLLVAVVNGEIVSSRKIRIYEVECQEVRDGSCVSAYRAYRVL